MGVSMVFFFRFFQVGRGSLPIFLSVSVGLGCYVLGG